MAQEDYIISNAPGINVREDINATLQAIVSNNSGVTEPFYKYPGMTWLDLSSTSHPDGIFRYRNQANDKWLPLQPPPDGQIVPNLNADMLDGYHADAFAVKADLASFVGFMAQMPCINAPANYLKVNGATLLRSLYQDLFQFALQSGLMASTQAIRDANPGMWGPGDGSTTFQLPDLRGYFLRVSDDGRGVDSGRGHGSIQGSTNAYHTHTGATDTAGWHGHDGSTNAAGAHAHTLGNYGSVQAGSDNGGAASNCATGYGTSRSQYPTDSVGDHGHYFNTNGNGNHVHNVTVYGTGGNESRPINASYPIYIRYK